MTDSKDIDAPPGGNTRGDSDSAVALEQARGRLLQLSNQLDQIEERLEAIYAEARSSAGQTQALTQHLTGPEAMQPLLGLLTDLLSRAEQAEDRLNELSETVTKLSRMQFKSNALTEGKEQQVERALAALQEIATRREEVRRDDEASRRQRSEVLRTEGRLALAGDLLPVLDGLDRVLESGTALLQRSSAPPGDGPVLREPQGLWASFWSAFTPKRELLGDDAVTQTEAVQAWLEGIELVRERFLRLLALEDIHPITALDSSFDPRLHVAVAAAEHPRSDVPPGTIVDVVRRGYRKGERVLRYAEVVVARASEGDR